MTEVKNAFSDYSSYVRESLDNGEDFTGPIWSEAEIDAFLDDDVNQDVNPNMATEMVEAAMYRLTGINIDMAVQGAALLNIGRASYSEHAPQLHNTITIEESEIVERYYDLKDPDYALRPILTPEDPNVAVTSIDMPIAKPSASKLDLVRMNPRENPVEAALMDQLVVLQCLYYLGADVIDLINHVSESWGLPFVDKLVKNVALAPVADISMFLAAGGRPAPQIYMSANYTSRYRVINRVRADYHELGHSNAFLSRSTAIAKFVAVMCNLLHGRGSLPVLSFHTNPSQMSRFYDNALNQVSFATDVKGVYNGLSEAIVGRESYESFLRIRQATRQVDSIDRSMAAADLIAIGRIAGAPRRITYAEIPKDVYDPRDLSRRDAKPVTDVVNASNVVTMLLNFSHGSADSLKYIDHTEISEVLCTMATLPMTPADIAKNYSVMLTIPGIRELMRYINIDRVENSLPEVEALNRTSTDARRCTFLYLMCRYITLTRVNHDSAYDAMTKWAGFSEKPRAIKSTCELGGYIRPTRFMIHYMKHVISVRPHCYRKRFDKVINSEVFGISVFDRRYTRTARDLDKFEAWLAKFKSKNKGSMPNPSVLGEKKFAVIFAEFRDSWSKFYESLARVFLPSMKLTANFKVVTKPLFRDLKKDRQEYGMHTKYSVLVSGALLEYCIAVGKSLAYRFYHISIVGMGAKDPLEAYAEALKTADRSRVSDLFMVSDNIRMFDSKSALRDAAEASAKTALKFGHMVEATTEELMAVIQESYKVSVKNVTRSVTDLLLRDIDMVQGTSGESVPRVAPRLEVEETKSTELVLSAAMWPMREYGAAVRDVPEWARALAANMDSAGSNMLSKRPEVGQTLIQTSEVVLQSFAAIETMKPICMSLSKLCDRMSQFEPINSDVLLTERFFGLLEAVRKALHLEEEKQALMS